MSISGGGALATGGGVLHLPDAGEGTFVACEAEQSQARGVGLDMYIVFDRSISMRERSGSMAEPDEGDCPIDLLNPPAIDSKWCLATNALAKFFTSSSDRDVRVAFQYMISSTAGLECGAFPENPHATPSVGFVQLPVEATHELVMSLESAAPDVSGTNIEGALNGLALFTAASSAPPRSIIGVLITDGNPQASCQTDVDRLVSIPQGHFDESGIKTIVIGMTGATPANLERLAAPGGGPEHGPEFCDDGAATCHYWSVGNGDPAAFIAALEAIQVAVSIPCEYTLPKPRTASRLDPGLVQVKYTAANGQEQEFRRVEAMLACDATLGGWYYDDNETPGKIVLCPASCQLASHAAAGASVSLAYGCEPAVF